MKKKIISVLALVLVVCFVWVSQVDAANNDVIFDNLYVSTVVNHSTYKSSASLTVYENDITTYFSSVKYTFTCKWVGRLPNATNTATRTLSNFTLPVNIPANNILPNSLMIVGSNDVSATPSNIIVNYADGSSYTLVKNVDYTTTHYSNHILYYKGSYTTTTLYNLSLIEFSFVPEKDVDTIYVTNSSSSSYAWAYGFLVTSNGYLASYVPPSGGISDEQREANEQILLGIEEIGAQLSAHESGVTEKLDDIHTELSGIQEQESSFYEDLKTPESENVSAAESMAAAREEGQQIVDEYSSLNASLEKPTVDELLPDYDRVVDGYVDTSLFGVFSTLYESGYIMFMILITVFFGVMSYALFGKKA